MQKYVFFIPPEKVFRNYIISVISFLEAYFLAIDAKVFNKIGIENIIPIKRYTDIRERLVKAGETGQFGLSANNVLTIYAAYAVMNKLLYSHYGHSLFSKFEPGINEGHFLKEFKGYRDHYTSINTHFMEDIEKKLPRLPGLKELKNQIDEMLMDVN